MYYPIQAPYLLDPLFARYVDYSETVVESLADFVICIWSMEAKTAAQGEVQHVILVDGSIDLVVDFDGRAIVYAGMRETKFDDVIRVPERFFGARLKPGAFAALTGRDAEEAMDRMLPLQELDPDFDLEAFLRYRLKRRRRPLLRI